MLENIVKTLNSLNTADFLFVTLQEIMIILIKKAFIYITYKDYACKR